MSADRKPVLFVTHKPKQCGIYEFGKNVYRSIKNSLKYHFIYAECDSLAELDDFINKNDPQAIIYNYHPSTLPYLTSRGDAISNNIFHYPCLQLGIIHEITQPLADSALPRIQYLPLYAETINNLFDYYIAADPTLVLKNHLVFKTGRPLLKYENNYPEPPASCPVFASASLATPNKGFEMMAAFIQNEYDTAEIRLNIPFASFYHQNFGQTIAQNCRSFIVKKNIKLTITHKYFTTEELLDFLAQSTANFYLYEDSGLNRGVSSALDNALSVRRPIVISDSLMFRHVADAAICINNNSIRQIVANGFTPLEKYYQAWSPEVLCSEYEEILDKTLAASLKAAANQTWFRESEKSAEAEQQSYQIVELPANMTLNRVLDDSARESYQGAIAKLFELVPQAMGKKIPRANINQAFVFDTVQRFLPKYETPKILCIGSYEDTACLALVKLGYEIETIDPKLNYDLQTYFNKPTTPKQAFDIIIATSVIEHDPDDKTFMECISGLLAVNGIVIMTCDFKDGWQAGDPKPSCNARLYTKYDLETRLLSYMNNCQLVDEPQFEGFEPDFTYEGIYNYSFASFVAQKREVEQEKSVGYRRDDRVLRGLFLNSSQKQCSIHESGKMIFACLEKIKKASFDYLEINVNNQAIPPDYDFYFFNYHHGTMAWLDVKNLKNQLQYIMTVILETLPDDPFPMPVPSPSDFDVFCVIDPTIKSNGTNIFSFPRPLEKFPSAPQSVSLDANTVPIIGSFGFPTLGKSFDKIVAAVNEEFEKAIVRINLPCADFFPKNEEMIGQYAYKCFQTAKKGIEVQITSMFMDKADLIKWCQANTLNCFFYDRDMPGLCATTDQAIASGRPLSINNNPTFRHIFPYLEPYPNCSLKQSILKTPEIIKTVQADWSQETFAQKFDTMLTILAPAIQAANCKL